MKPVKTSLKACALATLMALGAPSSHAISPTLFIAAGLQPETMFLGFVAPVTSKEFLGTLGLVFNNVPYFKDFYGPMEQWLPRARKWSITPPSAINPLFLVPPGRDDVYAPSSYSQIIAFGDSMSDTGNLFKYTQAVGGVGMPSAPSYQGRFSNGRVALDVMSAQLRLPVTNYSFSGAQSGRGNLLPFWSWQRGLLFQVDEFHRTMTAKNQPQNDPQALYFVWVGPNDFFEGINMYSKQTALTVASNHLKAIRALYARGARQFMVPLMPDLSLTPQSAAFEKEDPGYKAAAKVRSEELKAAMLDTFRKAEVEMPGLRIRTFDTLTFLREELPRAAAEGVNVTESCYNGKLEGGQTVKLVCANPDNYLFWDKNHPTDRASHVLGSAFTKVVVAP